MNVPHSILLQRYMAMRRLAIWAAAATLLCAAAVQPCCGQVADVRTLAVDGISSQWGVDSRADARNAAASQPDGTAPPTHVDNGIHHATAAGTTAGAATAGTAGIAANGTASAAAATAMEWWDMPGDLSSAVELVFPWAHAEPVRCLVSGAVRLLLLLTAVAIWPCPLFALCSLREPDPNRRTWSILKRAACFILSLCVGHVLLSNAIQQVLQAPSWHRLAFVLPCVAFATSVRHQPFEDLLRELGGAATRRQYLLKVAAAMIIHFAIMAVLCCCGLAPLLFHHAQHVRLVPYHTAALNQTASAAPATAAPLLSRTPAFLCLLLTACVVVLGFPGLFQILWPMLVALLTLAGIAVAGISLLAVLVGKAAAIVFQGILRCEERLMGWWASLAGECGAQQLTANACLSPTCCCACLI